METISRFGYPDDSAISQEQVAFDQETLEGTYPRRPLIRVFKNDLNKSRKTRVGVGIPCHVRDLNLLSRYSLPSVFRLDPSPDVIAANINRGEGGLKKVRTDLFDSLFFEYDCDVIVNVDADMIVTKDMLEYISEEKVVSFGSMLNTPIANLLLLFRRFLLVARRRKAWNGIYSLPRDVWVEKVRDSDMWDGYDTSLKLAVSSDYDCVGFPKVMIMRRNCLALKQVALYHPLNRDLSIIRKCLRLTRVLKF